ncbi:MAG: hypothetical protein PUE13_00550, partial [Clostridiales bacterium]|nr:hypothetical protein [Clostridiales bacterium]
MKKRTIWFINLLTLLSLLMGSFSPLTVLAEAAEENIAYAVLGSTLKKQNIDVFTDSNHFGSVVKRGGREAWEMNPSLPSSRYMYVDISDSFGNSKKDGSVYEVEIDYYDSEEGYFVVWYDSVDYGTQIAKQITLKNNSKTWKTASFTLDNAGFSNGIDKLGDLKISTRERGTMLPSSGCNIYIGAIRIKRIPAANPLYIESYNDQPGNTYRWFDESKIVHNRITNVSGQKLDATVTYR